jgi:phosphonate transport system permease protein
LQSGRVKQILFDAMTFGFLLTVAVIAVLHPSDSDLLELGRNSLVVLLALVSGALLSWLLNRTGLKTLGEFIFEPAHRKTQAAPSAWYKTLWGWQLLIAFVVTFYLGMMETRFSLMELLDPDGLAGAGRLFRGLAEPNFQILPRAVLAIIETVFIAFIATVLAVPIAFVMSFFCAKNLMGHSRLAFLVYIILRTILNVVRSVEALIWAIIASVWVGIGPFAGMIALLIHSVASLAKQYSEIIEDIHDGPVEGIESTGANKFQTVWFAVVPQVILPHISFTIYRWDINVRMATIIGLVGGGGIGTMLIQYQGQAMWHEVGCIIVVIAVVVWGMDTFSAYIREAIR